MNGRPAGGEAGDALRRSLAVFQTLFDRVPLGLAVFDRGLVLQAANPIWAGYVEDYTSTSSEKVRPGAGYFELMPGTEEGQMPAVEQVLRGQTVRREALLTRSGGKISYWDLVLSPIFDGDRVVGFLQAASDATARIRAYRELEERVGRRTHELETLFELSQAIIRPLDPEAVLQLVADGARQVTGAARGFVFLKEGEDLELAVASGDPRPGSRPDELARGFRMPLSGSLSGRAIAGGEALCTEDAGHDPRANQALVQSTGIQSILVAPLQADGQSLGVVLVADKPEPFGEDDKRLLMMLASGAAVGLENARLYQEELERRREAEQRRRVAEGLREMVTLLNSERPLGEVLENIVEQAARLLDTETVAVYRLNEPDGLLTILTARGLPESYVRTMAVPLGAGAVGIAAQERRPVLISGSGVVSPEVPEMPEEILPQIRWLNQNFCALLAVPLLMKEKVFGAIALYYPEAREFSQEELDLADSFGAHVAVALENADLRRRAELSAVEAERSRLARELHDAVTQTLFSAGLIAEVLPRLSERDPQQLPQRLEELRRLTRGALAEMRSLLLELRPDTLADANLIELLGQLSEAVQGRAHLAVEVLLSDPGELPSEVKLALYRIAQEALNNVTKHANATRVTLELSRQGHEVVLALRDDGRGFDPAVTTPDSLGLGIMRDRAESVGARLEVTSGSNEGTSISVFWKPS